MIRHTLLLAYRNFRRFKIMFFINLIGLSAGLTCTVLIYLWVTDELRVDSFFENDDRLFQVMQNMDTGNGVETTEATPGHLATALAEELPEVEYAVAVVPSTFNVGKGLITVGDTSVSASGQYASQDFFNVFSYNLLDGDRDRVLSDKKGIVISESLALRLFTTIDNALGKELDWTAPDIHGSYYVSGVFQTPPSNATAQFDLLLNYSVYEDVNPWSGWGNSGPRTYVLLRNDAPAGQFNEKIKGFIGSKDKNLNETLFVQRNSARYLHGTYRNGQPSGGRVEYVRLFSIIGILILIIACVNFMNLSTAKALGGIREVGIKKALGAGRHLLIAQQLSESVIMAFLSLGVAILFVDLFMAQFNIITGKHLSLPLLNARFVSTIVLIAISAGLLSGSYPAWSLTRFKPSSALKGNTNLAAEEFWLRKGMVVFQFAVSMVLIVSVLVVYRQLRFVQAKNLGYKREHVIHFKSDKMNDAIIAEIRNLPGVINAGGGALEPQRSFGGSSADWEGKSPDDKTFFTNIWMTDGLIETLGMQMAAGQTFRNDFGTYDQIILNEKAIESMGLPDPIGKKVQIRGQDRTIVGIVKDFHFQSLYEEIKPCALLLLPTEYAPKVSVRIQAGTEGETIKRLQQIHHKYNPDKPFDFEFMQQDYERLYAGEQRISTLTKYFAALAILISSMGLFGLASFTAERRTKEIGIRKVLGSSTFGIVALLSTDFAKLVLAGIVVSLPIAYFIARNWLDGFAYKIDLEWWYFAGAGLLALIVGWLTVGTQAFKAARVNPVTCLRDE